MSNVFANRPPEVPVKVICLGLSRTGTTSMSKALEILAFGPCYHTFNLFQNGRNDLPTWFKFTEGKGTAADLEELFEGYNAILDQPAANFPVDLYAAYPNAKYILTTRDPEKWEKSMRATMFRSMEYLAQPLPKGPLDTSLAIWYQDHLAKLFGNRLWTHPQETLLEHNERIRKIVPSRQLLVFETGVDGWDSLCHFLNVPNPMTAFPHLNDTAYFKEIVEKPREVSQGT